MDKEKFLASGLLEQYALGLTSPEENRLVEHFIENYPEIRAKMNALQEAVEQYANKYAIPPPNQLKHRILSEILNDEEDEDEASPPGNLNLSEGHPSFAKSSNSQNKPSKRVYFSVVGTVLVALVLISILLWRQQQLQADKEMLLGELANSRSQYHLLEKEQSLFKKIVDYIENGDASLLHLRGKGVSADAHAVVYWNPHTKKSYVRLLKMPALPSGKQFQVWADVNGEMINAGVLDNTYASLQEVKFIAAAASLNITIEPLGGSDKPSVLLLVAQGAVKQDFQ